MYILYVCSKRSFSFDFRDRRLSIFFFKLSYSQFEFRFKIFIPLITRQVYEMIGFNGEIPSVSIQTEAFPLLKMPEGVNSSIIEPQTTQVRTKTSFDISPDGKSLMIIETR